MKIDFSQDLSSLCSLVFLALKEQQWKWNFDQQDLSIEQQGRKFFSIGFIVEVICSFDNINKLS